jgi:hypothetical protein
MDETHRNLYEMTPEERVVEHVSRMRKAIQENFVLFNRKLRPEQERDHKKDDPDGHPFVAD